MPFYEYQCNSCGHTLEAMQRVSDAPLRKCPKCGKPRLNRLMSAPVFRLKGSGWYETDFKSDKDAKRNLADQSEGDASKEDKKEPAAAAPKDGAADKPVDKADKPAATPAEKSAPREEPKKSAGAAAPKAAARTARRPTRKALPRKPTKPAKPARRR